MHIALNLLATILLTVMGIWGSHSIDTIIKDPFSKSPEVWGFYILTLAFVALFTGMLHYRERQTQKAQRELINKSDELEETIRTLPPEGFLSLFSEKFTEAHDVYKTLLLPEATKEELELSIRGILLGILRLTEHFDRKMDGHLYAANIMIFNQSYKQDENISKELLKNLTFADEDLDPMKLHGLLYLHHRLSTNSNNDDSVPDEYIDKILLTLPVRNKAKSKETNKFKVLPGAPIAIALNAPNIYFNARTICDWFRKEGDFDETIVSQVSDYFNKGHGKEIKSFFSLPLSCDGAEPIAVLNIHKNVTHMLSKKDQFDLYREVMSPFLAMLSELVKKWLETEDI